MGGLIGAAWASGYSAPEIEAEALRLGQWDQIFRLADFGISKKGVMSGRRLRRYLNDKLGENLTFDELVLPLALVAVDITTGREVVLTEGSVLDAMRATMSIPGLFAPMEMKGMKLVDGGLLINVPAAEARALVNGPVIAVDVMPDFSGNEPGQPPIVKPWDVKRVPGVVADLIRAENIMMSAITRVNLEKTKPEVLIRPDIPSDLSAMAGFHRAEECIRAGEVAAEASMDRIRELAG